MKEHACREVEGPEGDDVELADIYMELNRTYEKLGQLKEALDMSNRAGRIYRRLLGEHSLEAIQFQTNLRIELNFNLPLGCQKLSVDGEPPKEKRPGWGGVGTPSSRLLRV